VTGRNPLRFGALLTAGALVVHELRYLLAWGAGAHEAMANEGHAYLGAVTPLAVALCAVGLGSLLTQAGTAGDGRPPAFTRHWLLATVGLLLLFGTQETAEGALATGHPAGLAAVIAHGGWLAAPLALAVGAVIALAMRSARALLVARPVRAARAIARAASVAILPPPAPASIGLAGLGGIAEPRAPPVISV
jgi:hypothetical protein